MLNSCEHLFEKMLENHKGQMGSTAPNAFGRIGPSQLGGQRTFLSEI